MSNFIKSKLAVGAASLVFFILVIIVLMDYTPPTFHEFSGDNFYESHAGDPVDPREMYEKMAVGLMPGSGNCRTEMRKADQAQLRQAGNVIWFAPSEVESYSDISKYQVGDDSTLQPYADGDVIISPGHLKFVNSNIHQESAEYITIEATIGDILIRWEDVECWWCHEGKVNPNKHSTVVGAGGLASQCTGGYVIGIAKSSTLVKCYRVDVDSGSTSELSFSELFGNF